MSDPPENQDTATAAKSRAPLNFAAFVLAFFFVWLIFDNLALALIFALFAGGGSEAAQRVANKKPD